MDLNPPTESQLLVFWAALFVILAVARIAGALMQRIGQPAVVGELAAGLLLGPSVLGRIAPDAANWLFPADDVQTGMLFTVGWLGVLLLLVATGFETDLKLIGRLGRAATAVSMGSLIVPAAAGFAVGWMIPSSFVGDDSARYVFALFFAAALSISSLPVIAKILTEMGLMRRNFGQLTLAAGMVNDVIGWVALGFIAGLAQAGGVKLDKLAFTLVGLTAFFLLAFTLGQRAVDASLRRVRAKGNDPLAGLTVVLTTALGFGLITQWLHVEAVLGAFVAGIVLARSRFADHELIRPLETMTAAIFAPVFFATAGLRVDLGLLWDVETLLWAGIVLAAASASKFFGSLAGASVSGLQAREGAALGVGLNARGALEIVIATVGLSLGVLNERSYTVIVLMAMATSMAAPPLLRRVLAGWEGTPEERRRLDVEAQLDGNTLVSGGRVLIPSRGTVSSVVAAQVCALAWPDDTEITIATVGDHDAFDLEPFTNVFGDRVVHHRQLHGEDVVSTIVAEATLGYDAIVLGAGHARDGLFGELVDDVVRSSPIPVIVVRAPAHGGLPWAFARAVVPVNGGRSSRPAQELGAYLSSRIGTQLHHLHVSTEPASPMDVLFPDSTPTDGAARRVLHDAAAYAATAGASFSSIVEHAEHAGATIVATADDLDADLTIISGTSRAFQGDLFVGHTITHVVDQTGGTLIAAFVPDPALLEVRQSASEGFDEGDPDDDRVLAQI